VILQIFYKRINKLQQLLFPVGLVTAIASSITLISLSVQRAPVSKRGFTEGVFLLFVAAEGARKRCGRREEDWGAESIGGAILSHFSAAQRFKFLKWITKRFSLGTATCLRKFYQRSIAKVSTFLAAGPAL
jgi:hypothetical protein